MLNPDPARTVAREEIVVAPMKFTEPLVRLDDVSLKYDAMLALDRTTLSIEPGEFVAVVGPSGCGKSTMMKLVTGLMPPSTGEIRFGGKRVTAPIMAPAWRSRMLRCCRGETPRQVMLPLEIVEPYKRMPRGANSDMFRRAQSLLDIVGLGELEIGCPGSSRAACSSAPTSVAR